MSHVMDYAKIFIKNRGVFVIARPITFKLTEVLSDNNKRGIS